MDIYFCDLCAVRVTDNDLRSGNGIRSGHDAICGTCLEMGHGQDWLRKRNRNRAISALAPSPTLDAARDRVATLEADAPESDEIKPVTVPITAAIADTPYAEPESEASNAADPVALTEEPLDDIPAVDPGSSTDELPQKSGESGKMAAAAGVLSALAEPPRMRDDLASAADLTDSATAGSPDASGGHSTTEESPGMVTEVASADEPGDDEGEKAETVQVPTVANASPTRTPMRTPPRKGSSNPAARSGARPAPGKSPSGTSKGGKSTTRVRHRVRVQASPIMLIFSGISIVVLLVVMTVAIIKKNSGRPQSAPPPSVATTRIDDTAIRAQIAKTGQQVEEAMVSDDVAQWKTAHAAILATSDAIDAWQKSAASSIGPTQAESRAASFGWDVTYRKERALREKIFVKTGKAP